MGQQSQCPVCRTAVSSIHSIEIRRKRYPVFRCPGCTERVGRGSHAVDSPLIFIVDSDGRVLRIPEITALIAGKEPQEE